MSTYEDHIEEIEALLKKAKAKWSLDSLGWIGYEDICQLIRIHINIKWHLWDQSRPFAPWCKAVISHRITNLIRDCYSSFARPCLKQCPYNMGGDGCSFTKSGIQDTTCPDYAKWYNKKGHIYNIKMPTSIEGKIIVSGANNHQVVDYGELADKLHEKVLERIPSKKLKKVYKLLYIDEVDEEVIVKMMKFIPDSNRKTIRYKQLENLKVKFLALAKQVMEEEDIC